MTYAAVASNSSYNLTQQSHLEKLQPYSCLITYYF